MESYLSCLLHPVAHLWVIELVFLDSPHCDTKRLLGTAAGAAALLWFEGHKFNSWAGLFKRGRWRGVPAPRSCCWWWCRFLSLPAAINKYIANSEEEEQMSARTHFWNWHATKIQKWGRRMWPMKLKKEEETLLRTTHNSGLVIWWAV